VSFENQQDLLGHRSGRMTPYYTAAALVIEAAEKVCDRDGDHPELLRLRSSLPSRVSRNSRKALVTLKGVRQVIEMKWCLDPECSL
jgi:hypothetical protein